MTNHIESYYKSEFKEAIWLIALATVNFTIGLFAIGYWGDLGAGMLIMFGGFAIYQVMRGFWGLFFGLNNDKRQILRFEKNAEKFVKSEISPLEKKLEGEEKFKTAKIVSFLVGLLCVFMGAFGKWDQFALGAGVGLALQSGIMLIFGLLADYRGSFYLQKLKKWKKTE